MTVPSETSGVSYAGNGVTTVFSTGFYFLEASEVRVTLTTPIASPVIQTEGVHYLLDMPATIGAAGSIRMVTAPGSMDSLTIERVVPFTQSTAFRAQGEFSPAIHENAMDRLTFQAQQLHRRLTAVEAQGAAGDVIAGNGLSFSGHTLNVGAGAGIQSLTDTVTVAFEPSTPPGTAVVGAAALGTANTVARSDHRHSVSTGEPVDITDATNAQGTEVTLARSGHMHAHGNRGGGSLHAVATVYTPGFMSESDKQNLAYLLDAAQLAEATGAVAFVSSSGATPGPIATIILPANSTSFVEVTLIASVPPAAAGYGTKSSACRVLACFVHDGTNTVQIGTPTIIKRAYNGVGAAGDGAGFVPGFDIIGGTQTVVITVTGIASTQFNWRAQYSIQTLLNSGGA